MEFKLGDIVCLKSGGPPMTVEQTGKRQFDEEGVWCVWFEMVGKKQTPKKEVFSPNVLKKVDRQVSKPFRVSF